MAANRKVNTDLDFLNVSRLKNCPDINPVIIPVSGGTTVVAPDHNNAFFSWIENDGTMFFPASPPAQFKFSVFIANVVASFDARSGKTILGWDSSREQQVSAQVIICEASGAWLDFVYLDSHTWCFRSTATVSN